MTSKAEMFSGRFSSRPLPPEPITPAKSEENQNQQDSLLNKPVSRRDTLKFGTASVLTFLCGSYMSESSAKERECFMDDLMVYQNGKYILGDLPYSYDALEPYYDEQTLRLHHDKHHAGYVAKLNEALSKLEDARKTGDFSAVQSLSNALAFHGSGHILHALFWNSMKPGGNQGKMPEQVEKAFKESFGSAEAGMKHFAAATKAVEASGWGVLAFEPFSQKLLVLQCEKHQNLALWSAVPLLVCDVWEHAYYLKYKNNRGQWVDNFMQLANWEFVDQALTRAKIPPK